MSFRTKDGKRLAKTLRAWASQPRVGERAPSDKQLRQYLKSAGNAADHSGLRPWRMITLRGDERSRLGAAMSEAHGDKHPSTKPLRAPLLIAVVGSYRADKYYKVPQWEQLAVAVEVVHGLQLLLQAEGWGSFWRTGRVVEEAAVREFHGLGEHEQLLGWLYVGEMTDRPKVARKRSLPDASLTSLRG